MDAAELPEGPGAYVIHFEPPLKHARNYLGSAANLRARVSADLAGQGARIVAAALRAGSTATASRVWTTADEAEARQVEAGLKERRDTPRICPDCTPGTTRAAEPRRLAGRRPNRNPPVRRAA